MLNRILVIVVICFQLFACGSGGPKGAFDRAFNKDKKKEKYEDPNKFKFDISGLKGAYTAKVKGEYLFFYFRDNGVEIASKTDGPIKTCNILQPITQGPPNNLEIGAAESCSPLSLEILSQDGEDFIVKYPFDCIFCDHRFQHVRDVTVGRRIFNWSPESLAKLPPTIKSLQFKDMATTELEAARAKFKNELFASSLSLTEDLTTELCNGYLDIDEHGAFISNGKVITCDEFRTNRRNKDKWDTPQCVLISGTRKVLPKFRRKLAVLEVHHLNRSEGIWIFDQRHEGVDTSLTPEQRRTPTERKLPATQSANDVFLIVESADSEKNGNGIKSDPDLTIVCLKVELASPIQIEDVKKALGAIVE